jgi:hypothetical protein
MQRAAREPPRHLADLRVAIFAEHPTGITVRTERGCELFRRRAKIDEQDFSRCDLLFQDRVAAASVAIIACTVPVKTRPDRGSKMAGDKIGGASDRASRCSSLVSNRLAAG